MSTALSASRYSISSVMAHVDHMQRNFPFRKSGLGQDLAAANYVVDQLNACGLDAGLEEFDAYDSDPGDAELVLLGDDGKKLQARACTHIEETPAGGFVGQLIDVGAGGMDDYIGKDVGGKIVLAEVSYAPATPEKARIAALQGAAGIVLMNWGRDDGTPIPARGLKAVWGNPTPETWHDIPRIFGVSISRKDGICLRSRLAKGDVRLQARVTSSRVWRKLSQPIAWLHAPESATQREQFVIVSGHLDSWDPGVTDNLTGNSVMMEIARVLSQRRSELKRSVVFCFWNGHEVAEATGSACFVDAHWEHINRHAAAYFNIDSVGMKNTSEFQINTCPELSGFSRRIAEGCFGKSATIKLSDLKRVGDQSFFGIGVPAATGRHMFPMETVRAENGATLGWFNHTEFDTIDVLDENVLARDLAWCASFVEALCTTEILPHRFTPRIVDQKHRFTEMLGTDRDPANLGRIVEAIDELADNLFWFDNHLDRLTREPDVGDATARSANRLVLKLSRHLTFLTGSASGKYGQDSYGISTLLQPVPRLAELVRYRALEPDEDEARLLKTKLIRLRHELTDALTSATDLLVEFRSNLREMT